MLIPWFFRGVCPVDPVLEKEVFFALENQVFKEMPGVSF